MATMVSGVVNGPNTPSPQPDLASIMQFMAQMKQQKVENQRAEQQSAQQQFLTLMEVAKAGGPVDPAAAEKAFKAGFGDVLGVAGAQGGSPTPGVKPQQAASAGASVQNTKEGGQAGAAAAADVSQSAASKAPGEGVTPSAMSPNNLQSFMSQLQHGGQVHMQLQQKMEEMSLAAQNGDVHAQLKLAMTHGLTSGQGPNEDLIRSIYLGASPEERLQLDSTMKEFNNIKAAPEREMDFFKTLQAPGTPNAERYTPEQARSMASAWSKGQEAPGSIIPRMTTTELAYQIDTVSKLIDQGLPQDIAWPAAQASAVTHKPIQEVLPPGYKWGKTMAQQTMDINQKNADTSAAQLDISRKANDLEAQKIDLMKPDRVQQGEFPEEMAFLTGWKREDALSFLQLSSQLKEPENKGLKDKVDMLAIMGKAGPEAANSEQFQKLAEEVNNQIAAELGIHFEKEWAPGFWGGPTLGLTRGSWPWSHVLVAHPINEVSEGISRFAGTSQSPYSTPKQGLSSSEKAGAINFMNKLGRKK